MTRYSAAASDSPLRRGGFQTCEFHRVNPAIKRNLTTYKALAATKALVSRGRPRIMCPVCVHFVPSYR